MQLHNFPAQRRNGCYFHYFDFKLNDAGIAKKIVYIIPFSDVREGGVGELPTGLYGGLPPNPLPHYKYATFKMFEYLAHPSFIYLSLSYSDWEQGVFRYVIPAKNLPGKK